jgi:predicted transcriptional regulator
MWQGPFRLSRYRETVTRVRNLSRFSWRFRTSQRIDPAPAHALGPLEIAVMGILWECGESSVRDVSQKLDRRLAYTTVMTTLDRLFKKGLLERRKSDRAFLYLPRFSRPNWERRVADDLVTGFLARQESSSDVLLSCLVDAVGEHDEALLDELEKKIQDRRKELLRRE